jgi:outer membrane receptor for ferrienterochelin and colicin
MLNKISHLSKLKYLVATACLLFAVSLTAQKVTISGKIYDIESGEMCISASIYDELTMNGTVTNNYGYYAMRVSMGKVRLMCSYVGCPPVIMEMEILKDTTLNIGLITSVNLDEVVVVDKSPKQRVQSTQMSQVEMRVGDIKSSPVLLGETDIIKSLQLMPGVQSGTEGSAGFFVRGGAPDQNLILLDGVPVYNVNHLFGFFSVFNADAIKNVTLIKGGFPARYGGRLSSVVDIRMKEGNMKEFHVDGSIGLIASNLTIEGPIKKDKTSFIVSGRRTYYDLISLPFQRALNRRSLGADEKISLQAFFYDLNAKVNHIISEKDRVYLSVYTGRDKFGLIEKYHSTTNDYEMESATEAGIQWGNITTAIRWNHQYSKRLFSNLTATFSDFTFDTYMTDASSFLTDSTEERESSDMDYYSRIRDYGLKYDFDLPLNERNYLRFGISNTLHTFSPGVGVFTQDYSQDEWDLDTTIGKKDIPGNEFYVYFEDEIGILPSLKANIGTQVSVFSVKNKTYVSPEPRLSFRYLVNDNLSIKASYVWMTQYINLLTNTTIGLPTDLWIPSTDSLRPQKAWQAALGVSYSLFDEFEFTVEGYYKQMRNLVEFGEGYGFLSMGFTDLEDIVTQGKGESYGAEVMIQKSTGKFRGWISYTLSWSNREFNEISYGRKFPFTYDRRHNIAVVINYDLFKNISFGSSWVYYSGNAFTLPDELGISPYWAPMLNAGGHVPSSLYYDNNTYTNGYFEYRNNYKMPAYHRLDVGFNFKKKLKRAERTWSVGAYNLYNRRNAFMVYQVEEWDEETGNFVSKLKKITIFPIIPYFRYALKF